MPEPMNFRPTDKEEKAINELMQKNGLNQTDAIRYYMDKGIDKETNKDNEWGFLDDACIALSFGDSRSEFYCVWGRVGQPPQITKLGNEPSLIKKHCDNCKATLELKKENTQLKAQIESEMVIDIPSCTLGGRLGENGNEIYCNRTTKYEDVNKWCKIIRNGANCEHLRWTYITTKKAYNTQKNR